MLSRKVAVVTGAGSGIGRAIALSLIAEGAFVHLVGRTAQKLADTAEECSNPDRVQCHASDLAEPSAIERLTDEIKSSGVGVDILVHSAGEHVLGSFEATTLEEVDRQYRINFRGPVLLTRGLLPSLCKQRGQIVFINSSLGLAARAHAGPYSSMKQALKALADSLREEVNSDGVRVLSIFVGRTATPLQMAIHAVEKRAYNPELLIQPADVSTAVLCALTMPATAEITDIQIRPMLKLGF